MRLEPTQAELALMHKIKRSRLKSLPIRRQEVVLGYILDFYFPTVGICVEVDGSHHRYDEKQVEWDRNRDQVLKNHGIDTIRVSNRSVLTAPTKTVAAIREKIYEKTYHLISQRQSLLKQG